MIQKILSLLLAAALLVGAGAAYADAPVLHEGEDITIAPVHTSDEYKDLLMDSFDLTVLAEDENIRAQLKRILYRDEIVVDALAYSRIISAVNKAIETESLSEGASLDAYTEADMQIAADLIASICDALDLDFSIDPSNDSQNEYARVITIRKGNKVLGKLNADAKTDVGDRVPVVWIVLGGLLLLGAAWIGLWQLTQKRSFRA